MDEATTAATAREVLLALADLTPLGRAALDGPDRPHGVGAVLLRRLDAAGG